VRALPYDAHEVDGTIQAISDAISALEHATEVLTRHGERTPFSGELSSRAATTRLAIAQASNDGPFSRKLSVDVGPSRGLKGARIDGNRRWRELRGKTCVLKL